MKLTFITGNKNKFVEAKSIIQVIEQDDIDLIEIQSIDSKVVIEHKLEEARGKVSGNIIVEDNSLTLSCLNGLPGPLIKWFLKTIGNEGLVKLANTYNNFEATAKVVVGFIDESGSKSYFEGEIKGKIVEPRGNEGFGWDPIFEPFDSNGMTFGEMSFDEKNNFSPRKIAFQKLKEYLKK